ncbi:MAG: DUF1552 domain-containing protein [Polyangiaceae bacterium]
MSRSKLKLDRRTVLRGITAGGLVAVGLPLLDIMLNSNGTALADGEPLPMQFMTWFFGNGVRLDKFEPAKTGPDWEPSLELAPLAPVKKHINVLTGLQNRCSQQITHHEGMTAFNGYDFVDWDGGLYSRAGGPTIDQVIADKIGTKTPVKSVQVGVSKRVSVMDSGTTMFALSHRSNVEPLFPEFNPQSVWQTLFGEFQPKPDDRALRKSVLDAVANDVKKLKGRLGSIDNQRLDSHLASIAELEGKIATLPPACALPGKPTEDNSDINDPKDMTEGATEPIDSVNKAMTELLIYAFKCDITRVASLMFLGGAAETNFAEIGLYSGHHNNTHNPQVQNDRVHNGVIYIMSKLAYTLGEMEKVVDPMGKSLLDTGLVYISSDCSEGLTHSIARQPVLLAGNARGKILSPGIHYQAVGGAPGAAAGNISDVLLTVLQAYDPAATSVGGGAPKSTTALEAIRGLG